MTELPQGCQDLEEVAADLAVGALSGGDRAVAIAHLKSCARCRDLVDDLAGTADRLLLLAPVIDPGVGFESRVAARVAVERPARRARRTRQRWVAVAAAAALVAGLVGLGAGSLASRDGGDPPMVRTALAVSERTGATCNAVVYGQGPALLMVSLDGARKDIVGDYAVEAQVKGQESPIAVGVIPLKDGHGALGATVDAPATDVQSVRVLWQGRVLYEAEFQ